MHLTLLSTGKTGEHIKEFACLYGSIGSYPGDVETVEDAIEWEEIYHEPEIWTNIETDSEKLAYFHIYYLLFPNYCVVFLGLLLFQVMNYWI